MTLHELPDLNQGTDEWHDQRRGMVTASVVGKLVTAKTFKPADNDVSRGLMDLLVTERITGHTEPTYISDDMWRGIDNEPRARDKYAEVYAPVREVGFMVRDDWGFSIGYSPDGLVGDDGLIEIKSPRPKNHLATILSTQVPAHYMPQLQCGLLVSGRKWIDYVSYSGGMPMWPKRVFPDERWHKAIVEAVKRFELVAEGMTTYYRLTTEHLPMTERVDMPGVELQL